ncbi:lactonase family protein [Algoriphagus marinus]|uniref:lactonase family protein n=1 Tax=Algoriphagus marinus TaxID=1925762 RepID=UPI00094B7C04|nr:lactonase family protein [Algoriphagus marinus]
MKQLTLGIVILVFTIACNPPKTTEMETPSKAYSFLVGTYTDQEDQGINLVRFNPDSNLFEVKLIAPGVKNPSFVISNKAENLVFALEEDMSQTGGNVMTFSKVGDELIPLDTIPSYGDHPCYLALSPNEEFLAVGNYTGGNLSFFKVGNGSKLEYLQTIQHEGSSVNTDRQEKAHVHSTVFSPDGKYLIVADLGTDKIYTYSIVSSKETPLELVSEYEVIKGDGPRHLAFSSDGKTVFAVQELTANLEVLDFTEGILSSRQRLSMLEEGFQGGVGAAEVRLSPDGENVYVSNRGEANTISVFGKDESGSYKLIQVISSGGLMPRNFNLTSDGKYLLCAHQASNDIVVFERNSNSGLLSQKAWKVAVHKPVYLFPLEN